MAIVALLLALISGWLGLATSAYLFVKYRRGFTEVKFTHMLFYPSQKEAYRNARGNFWIERAKEQLKEQKYREAFYNLRLGSSLAPDNRDGRMLLAQFYMIWQRPDLAETTLLDGLEFNRQDIEYLQALFSFLLQRQADFALIKITDDLIARDGEGAAKSPRRTLIGTARATAQFFRGNYDAAEDTIRAFNLSDSIDGKILGLRIAWERGEREAALFYLEELYAQNPENEQIYNQYASFLREDNRIDELRRLVVLQQLTYPDRPRPRIDLLYIYDKASNEERVQSGIADIFRDFSANGDVMVALADFAANTGRPDLARRVYDHSKATNLPWEGAALMTVEAYVVAKQYREALAACTTMMKENPEWGKRFYSVFNGLQAIANYGLSDVEAAQLFLSNFLNQASVRADNLVAVSNRLVSVGANQEARQVLAQAVRSDPLNQTALTGLIRLDLAAGHADALATHLRTLLTMRKPPRDLLRDAYSKLASDRFLFAPGRSSLLEDLRKNLDAENKPLPGARAEG
ncbi:MAG: hypothetical protein MUE42_06005 [Opitutaceae bacterium]|nr:hypothetical protein [Opitutaceae bacterium]